MTTLFPKVAPESVQSLSSGRDARVARARSHVANALRVAGRGRSAEAERRLRDALGVLERRRRYAGAARAAATLGCLLRERGDLSRAKSTLERAQVLFDIAVSAIDWPGTTTPPLESHRAIRAETTVAPLAQTTEPESEPRTVHQDEREDYIYAQALLLAEGEREVRPEVQSEMGSEVEHDGSSAEPERSEALSALATGVIELMRPQRSEDELDPLCDRLKTLVGASRVAVASQTGAKTILVSVGSVLRSSGTRTGREEGARTALEFDTGGGTKAAAAIRVHDRNEPIANLLVWWSQPPSAATRLIVAPLLRLASVILAPSVQLALDRQVSSKVDHRTGLAGCSRQIADLRASVVQQASCPFGILIEGETGSGKEVVARALHHASGRRGAAFCAVNCAAVTDELFEAELFGHSRGAFTGAVTHRAGLFEAAHRGTLFLDEVGELSPRAQAKLLRAVQDGEVRRIGENTTRHVDVRIIAATNRTLQSEVEAGRFRQDLLFRLAVVRMSVPPLRSRGEDIVLLAKRFWTRALSQTGGQAALDADTLVALARHDWPGNVRELENVIAALAVRAPKRGWVGPSFLPAELMRSTSEAGTTLAEARRGFERGFVHAALRRAGGRPGLAARELGLSRQGLAKLMTRLDLRREA